MKEGKGERKEMTGKGATITHYQCNVENVKVVIKYVTGWYFGSGENSIRRKKKEIN